MLKLVDALAAVAEAVADERQAEPSSTTPSCDHLRMPSLEDELSEAMQLEVAPVIEKIKAEGGGLDGLGRIIEEVVIPLIGVQKTAILRLAGELDQLRSPTADEEDHGD